MEQLTLFETFSGAFSSIKEQDVPTDEEVLQVLHEQLQLESCYSSDVVDESLF